ncbi:unnamed protein product [Aspergillus oryzae RIB40]|uniref:DNA, SC009 n=1 Tax=Aspergillus oryzae (strain ATCC 42149 / RIB 40) TaxID=510516 RepID=Q2UV69_ASPOR|nr:LOW QUALITY PROTEIN: unnamed protein product [Aspergillus oryzae RIB40]BAE54543.1 unnamed protein product [Aspergillus oryzae RIB40]
MTASSNESRINLTRIAHVFYTHREIDKAHHFLLDFGFREVKRVGNDIYYRGTSSEPFVYCARQGDQDGFGGAAFVVESESDLFAATKLPGATGIYDLGNAPGGGRCVTFHDPIDKFPFHLVYGQEAHADEKVLPQLDYNFLFSYIYTYNSLIGNLLTFPANRQTPAREQNTTIQKGPCTRAQIRSFRNVCHQFCAGV